MDAAGSAYVVGVAHGSFPVTEGAYDTTFGGFEDAYVAKLSPDGSALTWATYLGGTAGDEATAIALDTAGRVVVAGTTGEGFPTTSGAFDSSYNGSGDTFVTRLAADGSALSFSTYLGGPSNDISEAVSVDAAGDVYVAGRSRSGFPTRDLRRVAIPPCARCARRPRSSPRPRPSSGWWRS